MEIEKILNLKFNIPYELIYKILNYVNLLELEQIKKKFNPCLYMIENNLIWTQYKGVYSYFISENLTKSSFYVFDEYWTAIYKDKRKIRKVHCDIFGNLIDKLN